MSPYEEKIIKEILEMIETNINIYYNESEDNFIGLRELCKDKYDEEIEEIDQQKLVCLVQETLYELIKCRYLYDFRAID